MLRLRILLPVLLALVLVPNAAARRSEPDAEPGEQVAEFARSFVGVPYRWGGMSPRSGFDCSGFVAYVYGHFGVSLPHYTAAQFHLGRRARRLEPGDLVFFSGLSHVGLYVGRGRFIHAPHSGTRVRVERMRGWYRSSFAGARRIALR